MDQWNICKKIKLKATCIAHIQFDHQGQICRAQKYTKYVPLKCSVDESWISAQVLTKVSSFKVEVDKYALPFASTGLNFSRQIASGRTSNVCIHSVPYAWGFISTIKTKYYLLFLTWRISTSTFNIQTIYMSRHKLITTMANTCILNTTGACIM